MSDAPLMVSLDGKEKRPVMRTEDEPVNASDTTVATDTTNLREVGQTVTQSAAGFGETPSDYDLSIAPLIEPIALYLTEGIAREVFDKWMSFNLEETQTKDPSFDRKIQSQLSRLKAKSAFVECLEEARTFDWCLLVGAFDDAQDTSELVNPLADNASLRGLYVYAKDKVDQEIADPDPESQRFGQADVYVLNRGGGQQLRVHYTRVYRLETGSILKPLWGDLTSLRNIRWSLGQILYRVGIGFPVVTTPAATPEQLEAWAATSLFRDIMHRSSIMLGKDMTFEFKGAMQTQLNPENFYKQSLEAVSIGSGIPEPTLRGAQAGAVTGSEINERGKYATLSRIQGDCEEMVRWVVDHVLGNYAVTEVQGAPSPSTDAFMFKARWAMKRLSQWLKPSAPRTQINYTVEWTSGFELSELDESTRQLNVASAHEKMLKWKTVDEIRDDEGLEPLPGKQGEVVPGLAKPPDPFGAAGQSWFVKQMKQEEGGEQAGGTEGNPNSRGSPGRKE